MANAQENRAAHNQAADQHEQTAKSHRSAAAHIEKGDHSAALKASDEAHGLSSKAHASSSNACSSAK